MQSFKQLDIRKSTVVLVLLSLVVLAHCLVNAADTRTQSTTANNSTIRQAKRISNDQERCETSNNLVDRVDVCAKPLMDILSGKLEEWPKTEEDSMKLCEDFGFSERCLKDASRKCAKGIKKTIVSTLGTSVQRVRKRECGRGKSAEILRTTNCIKDNSKAVQDWMSGVTDRLSAIETQQPAPEKRINAICCMVKDIDTEIKGMLDPFCPNEAKFVQRLFRGIIDNAVDVVCRQPKCNDVFKNIKVKHTSDPQTLISLVLKIVFSLDSE